MMSTDGAHSDVEEDTRAYDKKSERPHRDELEQEESKTFIPQFLLGQDTSLLPGYGGWGAGARYGI